MLKKQITTCFSWPVRRLVQLVLLVLRDLRRFPPHHLSCSLCCPSSKDGFWGGIPHPPSLHNIVPQLVSFVPDGVLGFKTLSTVLSVCPSSIWVEVRIFRT